MVVRSYYSEGEFVPGSPAQVYYYAPDGLGSPRRIFSTSGAPTFDYDPYGVPLQATPPVADVGFAGMFFDSASELSLPQYRAYDFTSGRWLSRDPIGEASDSLGNLYTYAAADPVSLIDPLGTTQFGVSGGCLRILIRSRRVLRHIGTA